MERQFDLEVREARRIIREHNDSPDDFNFTRTRKKRPGGRLNIVREYTVTVSRGKAAPVTYEGGHGKNWVVLFAHDLGLHRFSREPDAPDRPEFDERPASRGIFFVNTGPRPKMQIVDGDIVTLRLGDVSAIVHAVAAIGESRYRGTIVGFEKCLGPTCKGYTVGDKVEFTEQQIFGCAMT